MSLGYAEKLSYRDDVGAVGQKEHLDEDTDVTAKCKELAEMLRKSKKTVIMTGAGISTSIGIPDFRGPNGVWTCQKHGKPIPKLEGLTFASASPSHTHMALVELLKNGPAQYVVSQNVDGLHRRSGIPAEQLAEVHGNCFLEKCQHCGTVYVRDFEMSTVGFQLTGRKCTAKRCRGTLKDMVLDWDDALPEDQLEASEAHARDADLVICLGTSLQIRPICNLPNVAKRNGGQVAIVNLQKTPKNKIADLVIHGKCDHVMQQVMHALQRPLPVYERWDRFHLRLWRATAKKRKADDEGQLHVALSSAHGMACPLPMVDRIQWQFLQPSRIANLAPGDAAEGCGLQKDDATKQDEGKIYLCTSLEAPAVKQNETADNSLEKEAQIAVNGAAMPLSSEANGSMNGSVNEQCSGEISVDGSEGPFAFTVDLSSWPSSEGARGHVALCLQLTFGCGADACLRHQNIVLDIAVEKVPCMMLASSTEKMWSAAESCQATLEVKTQVRSFDSQEVSTVACKLAGTAVALRSHSIPSSSDIKPPV